MSFHLVGTSGFASPALRTHTWATTGAAPDLLRAYASRFDVVEMDSTFQRAPSPETVFSWLSATPDDFSFTVRVPRLITHGDQLSDPGRIAELADDLALMGDHLRCLLFCLPPTLDCEPERIARVLEALPPDLRTAWEFRHPAGCCPEVLDLLTEHGATPVVVENLDGVSGSEYLPGGEVDSKWELDCCYVRFRRDSYTYADLIHWGGVLGTALAQGRDVFAFFKQSPEAMSYVLALSELLAEASG